MNKFEKTEKKKLRPVKNSWYDWLINYIPEPPTKNVGGFTDKDASIFNTNTPKQTVCGRGKKLSKPKIQHKINSIRNPFLLKKKIKKKEEIINRIIKDRIIRDIWTPFETEEDKNEGKKLEKKYNLIVD